MGSCGVVWIAERRRQQAERQRQRAEKQRQMERGIVALKTVWLMTKDDLRTFMCNSVIGGDASQAFWDGLDALRTT